MVVPGTGTPMLLIAASKSRNVAIGEVSVVPQAEQKVTGRVACSAVSAFH